jgi:hypothetical protein
MIGYHRVFISTIILPINLRMLSGEITKPLFIYIRRDIFYFFNSDKRFPFINQIPNPTFSYTLI